MLAKAFGRAQEGPRLDGLRRSRAQKPVVVASLVTRRSRIRQKSYFGRFPFLCKAFLSHFVHHTLFSNSHCVCVAARRLKTWKMQLPQGLALWKPISDRHFSPSLFYAPFYALLLLCSLSSSQKCLRQAGACCLVPIWLVWTFNFRAHADPAVEDPTGSETNHGFLYFCMALITLDRLVWSDLESFQRVTKEVKDGKAVLEPVPRPWSWKRFKWSLSLIFSFRKWAKQSFVTAKCLKRWSQVALVGTGRSKTRQLPNPNAQDWGCSSKPCS